MVAKASSAKSKPKSKPSKPSGESGLKARVDVLEKVVRKIAGGDFDRIAAEGGDE